MNAVKTVLTTPFGIYVAAGISLGLLKSGQTGRLFAEKFGARDQERQRILMEARAASAKQ